MKKYILSLIAILFASLIPGTATAEEQSTNYCLRYYEPNKGDEIWDSQAHYNLPQALTKGNSYTLTLSMKATENCSVCFWPVFSQSTNRDQWNNSADVQYSDEMKVSTSWKKYTIHFTAQFPHDKLQFVFGGLKGYLFIDDVVLKDDNIGVNFIINGDFAKQESTGWSTISWSSVKLAITDSDNEGAIIKEPVIPEDYPLAEQGNPNHYVFLCFGQSNMEGNAAVEAIDKKDVPTRFKSLAAVNYSNCKMGNWRTAIPPLCREYTGLTPVDYFGRTLVEKLPEEIEVGVINVAVGGAKIELFMEEFKDEYIAGEADWFKNYCKEYDNDPFNRLVEMGKIAQKWGVIKGILLHQGESNNGQSDWAEKVIKVYKRLCWKLGLRPEDVPLLAGETLYENKGGACSWHNVAALPNLPKLIPNAYIISAKDLPGNGKDAFHFSAAGYREFGKRYANKYLELWNEANGIITTPWEMKTPSSSATYDLLGRPATTCNGIIIKDGKKCIAE